MNCIQCKQGMEGYILRENYTCSMCSEVPRKRILFPCSAGHNVCDVCKQTCGRKCFCGVYFAQSPVMLDESILKYFRPNSAPDKVPSTTCISGTLSGCPSNNAEDRTSTAVLFANLHLPDPSISGQGMRPFDDYSQNNLVVKESGMLHQRPSKSNLGIKVQHTSSNLMSKRPINCPNSECEKTITMSSLVLHFSFDHPKIAQQNICFGEAKVLPINLNDIPYGKGACIALILLNTNTKGKQYGSRNQTGLTHDIAFPLLAARIMCQTPLMSSKRTYNPSKQDTDFYSSFDIIVVWLCSSTENVNCTLEVMNPSTGTCVSYSGQTVSLRNDNNPYAVFSRANCLVLHSCAIEKLNPNENYEDERFFCDLKIILTKSVENLVL